MGALKICKRNFYEFHKLSGAPLFIVKLKKSTECFIIIRNLPRVRFWESGARSWAQNEARKYKFANCDCDALLRSRNCIGLVLHKKWEATIHFLVNFYLNLAILVLYILSYRTSLNSIFPLLVLVHVREIKFQTMHFAPALHVPYQISLQISSSSGICIWNFFYLIHR